MNDDGKSDKLIVPKKDANKGRSYKPPAECLEGRGLTKGNQVEQTRFWTQGQVDLQHALDRIRAAARKDKKTRFTALWHHVYNVNRLRQAFQALKRNAAPGEDAVTWHDYEETLEDHLKDLSMRLQRGAYKARPVKRMYIPKPDGRERPIGITSLEDKIVQRATVEVLNGIYETDFLGFSYGFRPGRSQHKALDAVTVGLERRKINWVLDADIRGFFDTIDHDWMLRFMEHRIGDRRVQRHIKKWLKAGVLEDQVWRANEEGTPQGGVISPLLGNVYLHYAFDLWAQQWREQAARGDMIIIRYADDIIVGFQHRDEAEKFQGELRERLKKFNLQVNETKTRLIEFGRFAAQNRQARGEGKPETFNFLGFTHICGKTRRGKFCVLRITMAKKMHAKLEALTQEMRRRMHRAISDTGQWLRKVLQGHYQYYGVPRNIRALSTFRYQVLKIWKRMLRRRGDKKKRVTWEYMDRLAQQWLPRPRITQPYPNMRLKTS
ncbi:MAG: Group II intron-encoded protein LtrA [Candidatus Hydrogenedentes bacterium ADurb.Bin101]|nr:MAG: Group II intron-encoded protein LtrA [Candidatus Hydrogenedentes bacterium ADurb.Bin101]HOC69231.1 group II intron reverse transcriptase/maturase [Candidatus Hydrogenedentota bacterium]